MSGNYTWFYQFKEKNYIGIQSGTKCPKCILCGHEEYS